MTLVRIIKSLIKRILGSVINFKSKPALASHIPVVDPRLFNSLANLRIAMTVACTDSDSIPKVEGAGTFTCTGNTYIQTMHDGTKVKAGGYEGWWMASIITRLNGHHEPQEELLFHHLLNFVSPDSLIVELGSNWAYYSNWYLGKIPGSTAVCVEPDATYFELGKFNMRLNNHEARFIQAFIGSEEIRPSDKLNSTVSNIPQLNMPALSRELDFAPIEVLHVDIQGAEVALLDSFFLDEKRSNVRFIIISTHHEYICGSKTIHQDCLKSLNRLGAVVLAEHSIEESYSADGLILASFNPDDAAITLPSISRAPKVLTDLFWEHMHLSSTTS